MGIRLQYRSRLCRFLLAGMAGLAPLSVFATQNAGLLFEEDFESGLSKWSFPKGQGHQLIDSDDPRHGKVLSLQTVDGIVVALMRDSGSWAGVRIEGDVLFPVDEHNYLGFVYRYRDTGVRTDFGSLYIKGNSSYVRVNPHHDMNVGRTLYEEFRTPLKGAAKIEIGKWKRWALEIIENEAHLYVGDLSSPQVTFPFFQGKRGAFGFKPRNPGGAVWVDNITVRELPGFTYTGPPRPNHAYRKDDFVSDWHVLGPLTRFHPEIETRSFSIDDIVEDGGQDIGWRSFSTDPRGAVLTGMVTQYVGDRRVVYFHATVTSDSEKTVPLGLSSVDDLALWINGRFRGFFPGERVVWWDFPDNVAHRTERGKVTLRTGQNHVLVRVVGGVYATGGYFLHLGSGEIDVKGSK